jgi:hypothetical protein
MTTLIRLHATFTTNGRMAKSLVLRYRTGHSWLRRSSQRRGEQSYSNARSMLDRHVAGSAQDTRQGLFTSTDLPVLALEGPVEQSAKGRFLCHNVLHFQRARKTRLLDMRSHRALSFTRGTVMTDIRSVWTPRATAPDIRDDYRHERAC